MSNNIKILVEDLKSYEKQINFILLKMNWRISEEQKKEIDPLLNQIMDKDRTAILQIAKQVQDLELFMPEKHLSISK